MSFKIIFLYFDILHIVQPIATPTDVLKPNISATDHIKRIFNLILSIIKMENFFNSLDIKNKKIINYAQKIDELIMSNKYDQSDVKYLIKNVVYPIIKKENKKLYKAKKIDHQRINIKYIFELIIFSMHVIVMNHTMPVYVATEYHKKIYNLAQKLDDTISKSKDKETIYKAINSLTYIVEIIGDEAFDLSDDRIKMLYDKKNKVNLNDRKIMRKQLENKLTVLKKIVDQR